MMNKDKINSNYISSNTNSLIIKIKINKYINSSNSSYSSNSMRINNANKLLFNIKSNK